MAATVRFARVTAATAPGLSRITLTSSGHGSTGTKVRLAEVTAQSVSTEPTVRLAGVAAVSGHSDPPTVRLADVRAFSPTTSYRWDGSQWVPSTPDGIGLSRISLSSTGSGAVTAGGTGASTVKLTSDGSASTVAFTGTLALSGGGTFAASGAETGPEDHVGTLALSGGGTLKLTGSALQGPPGAGSLTVVPQPDNWPPRILLELTGALGTQVTITRVDAAGNRSPVREANPAVLDAGAVIVSDYEAPYNQTVHYVATTSGPTITSDPVTLTADRPWLVHPGIPDLSQPLTIASLGQRTYPTNQGVHRPLGRRTAIVITDGQRQSPTYDLTVRTETEQQLQDLLELVDDAQALLLQIVYPDAVRTRYEWVSIGDVTEDDIIPAAQFAELSWVLPCTVVDAPAGLLQAQRTLGDLAADFATLGDIAAAYDTLRDVILDNRSS